MNKPFGAVLLLLASGAAHATIINFDTLAAGAAVTNQFAGVTFSAASGLSVFVFPEADALSINPPQTPMASAPNVICATAAYAPPSPNRPLVNCGGFTVTFASAVDGFSIDTFGWDSVGTGLAIRVFQGLASTDFTVTSPQQVNDKRTFSTALAGITSVVFIGSSDPGGNTFDNINFTVPGGGRTDPGDPGDLIPEPSAMGMMVLGGGLLALARHRSAAQK